MRRDEVNVSSGRIGEKIGYCKVGNTVNVKLVIQ